MGLVDRALAGDRRALSLLTSILERGDDEADAVMAALPTPSPTAHVVGLTGPPGAGKSSIVNRLISASRGRGDAIAVLLVDPSSPFTGGAVLGDRVRLDERPDDGVFVRSVASRGWEGGLAPGIAFMLRLFAAAGFGTIVVESVGVGQDAVDIRQLVDTVVVVQVPNLGDTVQTLKAGILEIADVYVVNKADLPGCRTTVRELNALLRLAPIPDDRFDPAVVAVSTKDGTGLGGLNAAVERHRVWLAERGDVPDPLVRQTTWYLRKRLEQAVRSLERSGAMHAIVGDVVDGRLTSREATARVSELLTGR